MMKGPHGRGPQGGKKLSMADMKDSFRMLGRVLGVVGRCKCLPGAISKAYAAARKISFTDLHMRSDIGQRALAALEAQTK